jgi:peroxiredoxin
LTVLAIGWALAVLLAALAYRLVRDRGVLLLRIEALESRLGERFAPAPDAFDGLPVGSPAPDFALRDLEGEEHPLEEWRGRRALLIFFDPGCGYCRRLLPDLARLDPAADPAPLLLAAGDADRTRALVAEHGVTMPVLLDAGAEVARLFAVPGTPAAYLVDEEGQTAAPLAIGGDRIMELAAVKRARRRPLAESKLVRTGLEPGTPAPPFTLPLVDGGELSLESYLGRRVLLVFLDPSCAPCETVAPELERLHRSRDDLAVVAVSRGDPSENRAKLAEHGLTFPVVIQRHWDTSREYGIFAVPVAYLIDEDGVLASGVAVGPDAILGLAAAKEVRRAPV